MHITPRPRLRSRRFVLSLLWISAVAGCGGAPSAGVDPTPAPTLDGGAAADAGTTDGATIANGPAFAALDAYLDERLAAGLNGFAMQVFDSSDKLVYQREAGVCATPPACPIGSPPFTVGLPTGIASVSKWMTSTTVLAVLDEQVAAGRVANVEAGLDTKVVPLLACAGLTGPMTDITMRQLLSFTSGVLPEHKCTTDTTTSLAQCACTILQDSAATLVTSATEGDVKTTAHPPGSTYKYGSSHLVIAGAVVEKLAQKSFAEVFAAKVSGPLGLASTSYKSPKNLAGSVDSTVVDVARFVGAIFHDGRGDAPRRVLSPAAANAQRANQMPAGVVRLTGPQPEADYGLNTWRWCFAPLEASVLADVTKLVVEPSCAHVFQSGHGGKGGYEAFLDVGGGYYAAFAAREKSGGGGAEYTDDELQLTVKVRLHTHLAMTR